MARILKNTDFNISALVEGYDYVYLVFNRGFV